MLFPEKLPKKYLPKKQQKLFSIVMSWKKREKIYHYYFYPFIHISSYNYENAKKSWLLIDRSILSAVCLLPASASDAGHCWRWQDDSDSCWPQKLLKSAGLLVPVLLRNFISVLHRTRRPLNIMINTASLPSSKWLKIPKSVKKTFYLIVTNSSYSKNQSKKRRNIKQSVSFYYIIKTSIVLLLL